MSLETLKPKVAELIEKVEGLSLPDWDDDSPIMASGTSFFSGVGYIDNVYWELTEKGTLFWRLKNTAANASLRRALIGSTFSLSLIDLNYQSIASKIKQIYVSDGISAVETNYSINCERIRLPNTLTQQYQFAGLSSLKELDVSQELFSEISKTALCYNCGTLKKIVLNPLLRTLPAQTFQGCYSLTEIDLSSITTFGNQCFQECFSLDKNMVFNPNLISIGMSAFYRTRIKGIVFQNSIDNLPEIATNSFASCRELTDIYCPWAEGAVANAPWGATSAQIHYNYNAEV